MGGIQAISRYNGYVGPYDPWSPEDSLSSQPKVKRPSDKLSYDTVQQWETPCHNAVAPSTSPSPTRPKLESPQISKSPSDLIKKLKEIPYDAPQGVHQVEVLLLQLLIECTKAEQANKKEDDILSFEIIKGKQQENKEVMKSYFNLKDQVIAREKTSKVLGWVKWTFTGALIVTGVASVVLTIATGGAAAPAALILINSVAATGTGATGIAKGVLDHKSSLEKGKLKEMELERFLNNEMIKKNADMMKHSMTNVAELWKQLVTALDNIRDAQRAMVQK